MREPDRTAPGRRPHASGRAAPSSRRPAARPPSCFASSTTSVAAASQAPGPCPRCREARRPDSDDALGGAPGGATCPDPVAFVDAGAPARSLDASMDAGADGPDTETPAATVGQSARGCYEERMHPAPEHLLLPRSFSVRRSELTCPASSPKMMTKAAASGADEVILDLEDAVALSQKESARASLIDTLPHLEFGETLRAWRCNGIQTRWC